LFELGKIYANGVEDCGLVINTYEELRTKFPKFDKMDEVLFHLYYCYNKNGDEAKATELKSEMNSKYSSSNFTSIVTTGQDPNSKVKEEATKTYEDIYELFIEGKFDEAVAQKKIADSIHGETYWTPQLLYIESVYYIKQRNDSTAIAELKKIQAKYPGTPLADKATTMIDVLGRRKQIEDELTNLDIKRYEPEVKKQPVVDTTVTVVTRQNIGVRPDSAGAKKPVTTRVRVDSVTKKTVAPVLAFSFNPQAPEYVMIILNKVDVVFGNETKNAFARYSSEKYYNKTFEISSVPLDADNKLVLIKPFENAQAAIDYIKDAKPKAATEIIPWLKADKYSFSIISDQNLEVLKANPDLTAYKLFLEQNLPGKF
jgi:outer membrane protein assembly factor BamD (BamD/ComL family)